MKKKVLFIIWSFTAGGGAERILSNIVNNLNVDKYEIDILEIVNFDIKKENIHDNINILNPILKYSNCNIFSRKISNLKSKILYYILDKKPSIIRNKFIKKYYDIEISFNYLYPTFLLSNDPSVKKIAWIHSSIEDLDYRSIEDKKVKTKIYNKYKLQKKHLDKIDKIITISDRTFKSVNTVYPEYKQKNEKIYNGYNFEEILFKSKEEIRVYNSKNKIVTVSKIDRRKNIGLLVEAAKILNERNLDFIIDIIGEGEETNNIKRLIKEYGLQEKIKMHGFKENPYPFMKNADVYCLTSYVEGFPTVLVESMICGCPFVSTKVAGLDELNPNEKCGISVDWNAKSLANALEQLLTNDELRSHKSDNCTEIVKQFALEEQIKNIEIILDK